LKHFPPDLLPHGFHSIDAHVKGFREGELTARNIIEYGIAANGVEVAVLLIDGRRYAVVSTSPGLNLLLPIAIGYHSFPATSQISVVPFAQPPILLNGHIGAVQLGEYQFGRLTRSAQYG